MTGMLYVLGHIDVGRIAQAVHINRKRGRRLRRRSY